MVDMNDYGSCAQCILCYEQLKVIDEMKDSRSWAQVSWSYEQLRVMDDKSYSNL